MAQIEHHQIIATLDGNDISLEQIDFGDSYSVLVEKWQLREICERFGIIASDHQAQRTIATLTRRLLVLNDRIDALASYMTTHTDTRHTDLTYELASINALNDIAAEFVAELDGLQVATEPPNQPPERAKQKAGADPRQMSIDA